MLLAPLCLCTSLAGAVEVALVGLSGNRALLSIDGSSARRVAVGETVDAVKLISVQGDQAIVQINGRKRALRAGDHTASTGTASNALTLKADTGGHFYVDSRINGGALRMMVDTGASAISIGASDARRLGLNPTDGQPVTLQTANGQARAYKTTLDRVQIGDISVNGVEAVIHSSDMPIALLGMSFLNRMDMQRSGDTMTLKKRY